MKLPLLISVPHAGLTVPSEAQPYCILTAEQIAHDGDEGAAEIYDFAGAVARYLTTPVARAIIDLNRAVDDRRTDGVVKTHTCWQEPVYDPFPPVAVVDELLDRYYHPYHHRLVELAGPDLRLAIDCHTMAAHGPPIGPDPGAERPLVCLSNAEGTCSEETMKSLAASFEQAFETPIAINAPFKGGYITRTHAREMPWVQLELSRTPSMSSGEKRRRVLQALSTWCDLADSNNK